MSANKIADSIREVLHTAPVDRGTLREVECFRCAIADAEVVALVHTSGDRLDGHRECGEAEGYSPVKSADSGGAS